MRSLFRRIMLPPLHARCSFSSFVKPLPSVPLPSPREAHLWYVVPDDVKDESLLKHYMELLPECEKENVLSMRSEALQKGALLARVLVRTTLSRYTHFSKHPKSFKFKKNKFGKPEVDWQFDDLSVREPLQFNISHTSSLIACGVSINMPIGIDVEEKTRKPNKNLLSLVNRFFSPKEFEYLNSFSDPENRRKEFIRLWTLKEAYVKAIGRGFSGTPFKEFTIQFEGRKDLAINRPESEVQKIAVEVDSNSEHCTRDWQFAMLELNSSHFAAVCMEINEKTSMEVDSFRLKVWKTIPFLDDACISKDALLSINGIQ